MDLIAVNDVDFLHIVVDTGNAFERAPYHGAITEMDEAFKALASGMDDVWGFSISPDMASPYGLVNALKSLGYTLMSNEEYDKALKVAVAELNSDTAEQVPPNVVY